MHRTRKQLVAWVAVGTAVTVSIALRVWHRGPYYPGFDVAGAANGLHLLSTRSAWDAITHLWSENRLYGVPFPYYSALAALLPGAATAIVPWEYWAHVTTLLAFACALWLLARAAGLDGRNGWVVPLALCASPTLVTLAVCGMAWASAFLPHALALRLVLDRRLATRPLLTLVTSLLTIELSWHCYELGKTVPAVFVGAAVVLPGVPRASRLAWLGVSLVGIAQVLRYPSMHVGAYLTQEILRPEAAWDGVAVVVRMLFAERYLDQPTLLVAGILACLVMNRTRLLLSGMLVLQVVLLGGLALAFGGQVRPRRFVMIDCYALALVATLFGETSDTRRPTAAVRASILAVLVAGSLWQLADLVRFVREPFPQGPGAFAFTLPCSHSQVDYMVGFENVDWAEDLARGVRRGERVLLVYNFSAYDENLTNPSGVLERLYVAVGHDAFVRSVFVFGSFPCRHVCLPIRPMTELEPFLDRLRAGEPVAPGQLTGFVVSPHPMDSPPFGSERARQLEALGERFELTYHDPDTAKFRRFSLTPRGDDGQP